MKNNIKNAPVKFGEDLLYFQHFILIFFLCSKSVIITTLIQVKCTECHFKVIYFMAGFHFIEEALQLRQVLFDSADPNKST